MRSHSGECYVVIVEIATGREEKRMGPMDERKAARVALGASINLNHERYRVEVRP